MGLLSQKTGLPSFSSADSPIVNYFTDSGFERGTNGVIPSGWAQYNDGATATPVDGTGGAAVSQVTMLVSNSSPIRGSFSAIISKDAANRQGVGYSFLFTISNVDKGVTAGVEFEMQTSANYASGDVVFYIYDVTNSILITPRAVSLPALPNFGRFISDYGLQTGTQYRFILHIATTNANAWTLKLDTMVNSTTRTAVPGAQVTNVQDYTSPTISGFGTISSDSLKFVQIGPTLRIFGRFTTGTVAASLASITLPNGGIVGSTGTGNPRQVLGTWWRNNTSGAAIKMGAIGAVSGDTYVTFSTADTGSSISPFATLAGNQVAGNSEVIGVDFTIPITQFSGSGTNGPASVTQWASDDGTSDVLGPQGSLVPNVAFGTGQTSRIFSFSIPQDLRQFVRTEINYRGNGWQSATDLFPNSQGNNGNASNYYGIQSTWDTPTNYRVFFGNRGTNVSASNVDNGSISWATEFSNGTRFRVGLSVGGVFIGINFANSSQGGFIAPRKGQTDLTFSSTPAGWSLIRAKGIYYQDQDGNHRLKFEILATMTSATGATATITGVTFKNVAGMNQPLRAMTSITTASNCYTGVNNGNVSIDTASAQTNFKVSGDVELESKPSWA